MTDWKEAPKLSAAQKRVLAEVEDRGIFRFAEGYRPAEKLADLGLARITRLNFGSCYLSPLSEAED